mgnify:CR=1 FL=1
MTRDELYMKKALELAEIAAEQGEVPVGAIVVKRSSGEIIGRGFNRREYGRSPLTHAELVAIEEASRNLGGWRLMGCDESDIIVPCKSFLKQLICLIRITLCVNRHRPCPLCDGPSDKSKRHFFSGSRFLKHFPNAVGISQVHKRALHHLIIFFRMEIHFFFCQIFRCRKSVV